MKICKVVMFLLMFLLIDPSAEASPALLLTTRFRDSKFALHRRAPSSWWTVSLMKAWVQSKCPFEVVSWQQTGFRAKSWGSYGCNAEGVGHVTPGMSPNAISSSCNWIFRRVLLSLSPLLPRKRSSLLPPSHLLGRKVKPSSVVTPSAKTAKPVKYSKEGSRTVRSI